MYLLLLTRIDYRQNFCQAHKTSGGGGHECLPAESGGGSSGDGSRDGREGCKTGATGGGVAGSILSGEVTCELFNVRTVLRTSFQPLLHFPPNTSSPSRREEDDKEVPEEMIEKQLHNLFGP